ncbi:helix-turn-helix domain-containing protein [Brevibacterium yomogidense]|uniref:helix-turn-helix domain-containing protein n=1 Tax=Brevibacterium yomogidense TaxID=946573 RepID=UPI0018E0637F|nr:helix-turn-helix transcriptional regulator [Brevibacterium yomogidense]
MESTDHRVQFGLRVRELRMHPRRSTGKRPRSQERFADDIGMDRTYIGGIERGRRNPTLDVIVRLADGLGVPPAELLRGVGSPRPSPGR